MTVPLQEREIQITRPVSGAHSTILTEEATQFLGETRQQV